MRSKKQRHAKRKEDRYKPKTWPQYNRKALRRMLKEGEKRNEVE